METGKLLKVLINVMQAELIANASVVRSGRNLTVVSIEIRLKETKKLLYTAQATLHHLPSAKL